MNLNGRLSQISAYKEELSNPVNITMGKKWAKEHELVPMEQNHDQQVENDEENTNTKCKAKRFWRTRVPINPDCKFFFVIAKPEGAPKGTRVFFLYDDPYCSIFDASKREIEIVTSNFQIFLEGRFIVFKRNGEDRLFSVKVENEQEFYDSLNNKTNCFDSLRHFFLLTKICKSYPNMDNMTIPFYNRTVNVLRFYKIFSYFPNNILRNIDQWEWFVRAVDPFHVDFSEYLANRFVKNLKGNENSIPADSFIYKYISSTMILDNSFKDLCNIIGKAKNVQENFVQKIHQLNLNERSKMTIHILYTAIIKKFPNTDLEKKVIFSLIVNAIYDLWNIDASYIHKADDIKSLDGYRRGRVSIESWTNMQKFFAIYKDQPAAYQHPVHSTVTFHYFEEIFKISMVKKDEFIKIIDKNPEF